MKNPNTRPIAGIRAAWVRVQAIPCLVFGLLCLGTAGSWDPGRRSVAFGQEPWPADPARLVKRITEILDRLEDVTAYFTAEQRSENLRRAAEAIKSLRSVQPDHPRLKGFEGRLLALQGKSAAASRVLQAYVRTEVGGTDWRAYRTLGRLLVDTYPQLGRSHYLRADRIKPQDPSILYGLSVAAIRLGALDEAIRRAKETCEADGWNHAVYVSHLGRLYHRAKRWKEAFDVLERAVHLARRDVAAQPGMLPPLALLDAQYQYLIEALRAKTAGGSAPTTEDALRLARALRERAAIRGKLAAHEALAVLEALDLPLETAPIEWLEEYGRLLAMSDRKDDAVRVFRTLLRRDPQNVLAHTGLQRLEGQGNP